MALISLLLVANTATGKVVGGRTFAYKNHKVLIGVDRDGNELFSHVERRINDEEAAVVRRVFELYDSGWGLKRIAKLLTLEGHRSPSTMNVRMD